MLGIAGLVLPAVRREAGRVAATGVASLAINLLHLSAPAYALYVLNHLAGPGHAAVLAGATLVVMAAFSMQYMLVEARRRLLAALAERVETGLSGDPAGPAPPAHLPSARVPRGRRSADLEAVVDMLGGRAAVVLCDVPWIVLFVGAVFWLDLIAGLFVFFTTTAGFAILAVYIRHQLKASSRPGLVDPIGLEAIPTAPPAAPLRAIDQNAALPMVSAADLIMALSAVGAFALALGLEAGELTATGAAIAAALLASRAAAILRSLAVVTPDVLNAAVAARRLAAALAAVTGPAWGFPLLPPRLSLRIEDLTVAPSGRPDGAGISMHLRLRAGDALAIVGPSGSGKTLLFQSLAGLTAPTRGRILLDGVPFDRWGRTLSRHIGVLPQEPVPDGGTIAQMIAGSAPGATMEAVVAAAQAASLDLDIRSLPDGYATIVGEGGLVLSAGQRQRLALARALFGSPFLLLLDDPLARLDAEGAAALDAAIRRVRARGGIVVSFHQHHPTLPAIDRQAVIADHRVRVVTSRAPRSADGAVSQFVQSLVADPRPDILPWGRTAGAPH